MTSVPEATSIARPLGGLVALLEARGLLRSLVPAAGVVPAAVRIRSVVMDSREVRPGALFVAIPGARVDGHEFVPRAVADGAAAVIAERRTPEVRVPQLLVHAARPALALAAAWLHDFPSHHLGVVGITGTDGKTTTCFMLRAALEAAGLRTGLITTVQTVAGGEVIARSRATTPEAPVLQSHLSAMVGRGDRWAIVESTSHGLAQDRVSEVAYDVAVVTNVTHEHLEFHRTHEAYRAAKRRLFERLAVGPQNPAKGWGKWAIVNRDDRWAQEFEDSARGAGASVLAYGTGAGTDVRATAVREDAARLIVAVRTPRWEGEVALPVAGRFNAHNALAALSVGEALGLDPERLRQGLETMRGVPGRMERIEAGQPFGVVVDYAHTAEALGRVLDGLAPVAAAGGGGVIAVFGSAGERDVLKRPMMGRVAGERCRLVVLTDEDPRGEDPLAILEAIAEGAEDAGRRRGQDLLLVPDRAEAITVAFEHARPGDVVLLAGKGHEATIETANGHQPWDEAGEARRVLAAMGYPA